jgi:hypothetical protein
MRLAKRNELLIDLGDLVSGQELEVVVKVAFPPGGLGQQWAVGWEPTPKAKEAPSLGCLLSCSFRRAKSPAPEQHHDYTAGEHECCRGPFQFG